MKSFRESLRTDSELPAETKRLANRFRVSTLVILRRMLDANWLTREEFNSAYTHEARRLRDLMAEKSKGGHFYNTAKTRLSPRFASAVIASTWEGRSTFTEAFRMLGCRSIKTMDRIAEKVGVGNPTLWEGG